MIPSLGAVHSIWFVRQFYAQVEFGNEIQISHDIIIGTIPLNAEADTGKCGFFAMNVTKY